LLPLCIGLTLLGILITAFAWRRGSKGRVLQGVAVALAPVALYFSGLLRLLWDGVVAVVTWGSRVVLSPPVWAGLSLLGLCLVLWVVGGLIARRSPRKSKQVAARPEHAGGTAAVEAPRGGGKAKKAPAAAPVDDEMAEIEALLKNRNIQ
jgi:hypothetical protein